MNSQQLKGFASGHSSTVKLNTQYIYIKGIAGGTKPKVITGDSLVGKYGSCEYNKRYRAVAFNLSNLTG